ncbi:MAG: peptidase [Glaciihabitans sp.]|jgi:cyanophycinase|nr:peptidase [Glaciihabitans sp.]MDQ1569414.1 cyanophycinase [Actinomycetota bacterium]
MSIHLAGGGWSPELFVEFLAESAARAAGAGRAIPRVGVLLVAEDDDAAVEASTKYAEMLAAVAPCDPIVTVLDEGDFATSALLTDIDGLVVGGGLTPAYLVAVTPIVDEIRLLVADGLPYLGFSAGAAIAADEALIGGWRIEGIPVVHEDNAEDLDEVAVEPGLGLVDLTIEVHAAQWGNLARLIAATAAGLVSGGIGVDEDTVLIVGDGELRVSGIGNVWQVREGDDGVIVSILGADTLEAGSGE